MPRVPPLTFNTWPAICRAAGEARKARKATVPLQDTQRKLGDDRISQVGGV
ncbi:hypothetical protein [Streptomyces tubercidicus]|uniref:hypothetical protein n=1 Tax=Streptomyces tubercidicus TaxID=47759 RepID=UPI003464EFE3